MPMLLLLLLLLLAVLLLLLLLLLPSRGRPGRPRSADPIGTFRSEQDCPRYHQQYHW